MLEFEKFHMGGQEFIIELASSGVHLIQGNESVYIYYCDLEQKIEVLTHIKENTENGHNPHY